MLAALQIEIDWSPHVDKLIIGCGYLGRRIAPLWLAQGHRVAALTRSPQRADEFRRLGIEPLGGDILETATLHALPAAATVVYCVGHDRTTGRSMRETYVDGLAHVLEKLPRP